MNEPNDRDFKVITVGLSPEIRSLVDSILTDATVKSLRTASEYEKLIDHYTIEPGTYCLVSNDLVGIGYLEIAQGLSSCFQGLNILFITDNRSLFDLDTLRKNGFSEMILLPHDHGTLISQLETINRSEGGGLTRKFKAVKLVDLQPGEDLPFDVYTFLPMNKRFVSLSSTGAISEKKFAKLKEQSTNSIYIDEKQMESFYDFAADKLLKLGEASNDAVSETEKQERLNQTVRSLFRSILDSGGTADFTTGRELAASATKVVDTYLSKKVGTDLGSNLSSVVGDDEDSYGRAKTVSAIACLLSLSTGIGKPEDLAIAGLFQDIGLSGVATEMTFQDRLKLNGPLRTTYEKHPTYSLELLKEKRMILSDDVCEIIEKHHERADGKGFPKRLSGDDVPLAAQLLSYAESLETLMRKKSGKKTLTIGDAHETISREAGLSLELLWKVRNSLGLAA